MIGICRCLIAVLAFGAVLATPIRAGAEVVLVFAAASLKTALDQVAQDFMAAGGGTVTVSYAASSVLARQIQNGAPADVFISANSDWMDMVERDGLIEPASRVDLLSNRLVLIGAPEREAVAFGVGTDLPGLLGEGYLAMALVEAVPAGIYGKAALQEFGLWDGVSARVAQADNVRAALALVAAGAAPLGIVYRSDAVAEDRVGVIATIPAEAHPPIIYPLALTQGASAEAQAFAAYLQSDQAGVAFTRQGFSLAGD